MHDHATIRAWKDADYRQMLSAEDAAAAYPGPLHSPRAVAGAATRGARCLHR